jgi:hypothetical protein
VPGNGKKVHTKKECRTVHAFFTRSYRGRHEVMETDYKAEDACKVCQGGEEVEKK